MRSTSPSTQIIRSLLVLGATALLVSCGSGVSDGMVGSADVDVNVNGGANDHGDGGESGDGGDSGDSGSAGGEPLTCGDGFCDAREGCGICDADCGPCTTVPGSPGNQGVVIMTAQLPSGRLDRTYRYTLSAEGGDGEYVWEVSNGTVLPSGLSLDPLTGVLDGAPEEAGSFGFEISATSGGLVASRSYSLAINAAPDAPPFIVMDFDQYESTDDLRADCTQWNCAENENLSDVTLDTTVAPPGGTRSMRYRYLHEGDGCNSITIKRAIAFPAEQEVWGEFLVRWSPNFRTTNASCYPNDHKLIFADTQAENTGRWAFYVGADVGPDHTLQVERPYGSDGFIGAYYFNRPTGSISASDMWDGEWHRIQLHFRNSTTPTSGDGALRVWIDGVPWHDETGFNTSKRDGGAEYIRGFSFAHNKDDGPAGEEMFLWWGRVEIYNEDPGW